METEGLGWKQRTACSNSEPPHPDMEGNQEKRKLEKSPQCAQLKGWSLYGKGTEYQVAE